MSGDYWWRLPEDVDAFVYAEDFVNSTLLPDILVMADNRQPLWDTLERPWFRPALELQVAGLCLLAGPLGNRTLAASFACFVVDHLVMGWNSILVSHPRVACTLSRHVVEASIFEVASVAAPSRFRKLWDTNQATGGKVVRLIKSAVPSGIHTALDSAWRFVVSFGHVSSTPVELARLAGPMVDSTSIRAVTFSGPHMGRLPTPVILHLGGTFSMIAEASLEAFAYAFAEPLATHPEWGERCRQQQTRVAERMATPNNALSGHIVP